MAGNEALFSALSWGCHRSMMSTILASLFSFVCQTSWSKESSNTKISPSDQCRYLSATRNTVLFLSLFTGTWNNRKINVTKVQRILSIWKLQVKKFKNYKFWNPYIPTLLVLSCPIIVSLSSSTANQRQAQNNYYTEWYFGVPGFVIINLFYLLRYPKLI